MANPSYDTVMVIDFVKSPPFTQCMGVEFLCDRGTAATVVSWEDIEG